MLSILEPGVAKPNFTPLSYTRLNSTYLQYNTETTVDMWQVQMSQTLLHR